MFTSCRLTENPICKGNETKENYCIVQNNNNPVLSSDNCPNVNCGSGKIQSPTCKCSHPQTGTLHFFSFAFSNFENLTYFRTLNGSLMSAFLSRGLPVDSVSVTDPTIDVYSYLQFRVQIFPSGQDTFNRTGNSDVGFLLNRQPFNVEYFGPFFYKADEYCCFGGMSILSELQSHNFCYLFFLIQSIQCLILEFVLVLITFPLLVLNFDLFHL